MLLRCFATISLSVILNVACACGMSSSLLAQEAGQEVFITDVRALTDANTQEANQLPPLYIVGNECTRCPCDQDRIGQYHRVASNSKLLNCGNDILVVWLETGDEFTVHPDEVLQIKTSTNFLANTAAGRLYSKVLDIIEPKAYRAFTRDIESPRVEILEHGPPAKIPFDIGQINIGWAGGTPPYEVIFQSAGKTVFHADSLEDAEATIAFPPLRSPVGNLTIADGEGQSTLYLIRLSQKKPEVVLADQGQFDEVTRPLAEALELVRLEDGAWRLLAHERAKSVADRLPIEGRFADALASNDVKLGE